jgi:Fe-S-cluster containining protein
VSTRRTLRQIFPPSYEKVLPPVFDNPEIVEARATCDNCAMCDKEQGPQSVLRDFFKPDLKCCTFHPHLPNYLVGAIFADPDPSLDEGRRRLREKIASHIGATPQWIAPPRKFSVLAEAARDTAHFGRSNALVCPFLEREKGLCTVWRHREAVCSTYFCKYTQGARGWEFWNALKEYVGYTEVHLSAWIAKKVDPNVVEPRVGRLQLTVEDLEDRAPSDADYARYWGTWVGREEEFYEKCHETLLAMTRADFEEVIEKTEKGAQRLQDLETKHAELSSTVLPARLVRNPKMRVNPVAGGGLIVTTYNRYDSFQMESELYDVLRHFNPDETVAETLARLKKDEIEIQPELLALLYSHAVLIPPPPKTEGE